MRFESAKILCFGDSNTWGYIPGTNAERYDSATRWPGVMQQRLGTATCVIEEALNGRTTVWDDPMKPDRNGKRHLPVVLESQTPIDIVIIALGVNDLKHHFHLSAIDVSLGLQTLAEIVIQSGSGRIDSQGIRTSPRVLLLSPIQPIEATNPLGHKFDGASQRSHGLNSAVAEIASTIGCSYLDASSVSTPSPIDGIHLDEEGHRRLGNAVAETIIKENLLPQE